MKAGNRAQGNFKTENLMVSQEWIPSQKPRLGLAKLMSNHEELFRICALRFHVETRPGSASRNRLGFTVTGGRPGGDRLEFSGRPVLVGLGSMRW